MLELLINKLPGGDASRTKPLARIQLTNTGDGLGAVKVYSVEVTHADASLESFIPKEPMRTHRFEDEDVLVLVHRVLNEMLARREHIAKSPSRSTRP